MKVTRKGKGKTTKALCSRSNNPSDDSRNVVGVVDGQVQ